MIEKPFLLSIKNMAPSLKDWFMLYSTPLFHINSKNQRELIGSGTFINFNNHKVLITARHVITDYPYDKIYVPYRSIPRLIHVSGTCLSSLYPLSVTKDSIDIACFVLDSKCLSDIMVDYKFLPAEFIAFDHYPSQHNIYSAVGVPHRKAKYSKADIGDISMVLQNILNPGSMQWAYKDEFNSNDHIIMDYGRKMLNDKTYDLVKTPRLDGMSGGSLWFIDPEIEFYIDRPNVKLVGILTQYCTQHIYATNIKHLNNL